MIGKVIREERLKRKITSKAFAETIGIDNGFLTHIEKGERNPSRNVLNKICKELNLSFDFMLSLLQNSLSDTSADYDVTNYTPTNKVLYAENISLIECPNLSDSVSFVTRMPDTSMEPLLMKDALLHIKYTSFINNGDICIVVLNGKTLIREFRTSKESIELISNSDSYDNIVIKPDVDSLDIIGKIIAY